MCIPTLWSSRPRPATGQALGQNPRLPVQEAHEVHMFSTSSAMKQITRLAVDIPAFEQVLTECGIFAQVLETLKVDIHTLFCFHIKEDTQTSAQYLETLKLIASSLQRIHDNLIKIQSEPPSASTETNSANLERIKKDLEVTTNAVKTLVLKEASTSSISDPYHYQESHRQFQKLVINQAQTSPGSSRRPSTANPSGTLYQFANDAQRQAAASPTPSTASIFAGANNTSVTGSVVTTGGSSVTIHTGTTYVYNYQSPPEPQA